MKPEASLANLATIGRFVMTSFRFFHAADIHLDSR